MRTRMLAAATVALAALSLTACGSEEKVRDEGAAKSSQSTSEDAAAGSSSGSDDATPSSDRTKTSGNGGDSGGSEGKGANAGTGTGTDGSDPDAPENRVPCTAANTSVTAAPVPRPLNYMLITITNTGSKLCDLPGYPILKFEGAQSVPPVIEDSKPQAVTSLKPGGKGYAAAILSAGDGSGGEGYTATSLQIGFQGSDRMADAALQGGDVHIDSKLRVSYWQSDSATALGS
ncbi:DUF4232 domain-containing protein [Streptomyces aureoverticillatus]|uniref:DUF4232 domain-containing protein n=1 Tax=Streptomyces aureoverticillatus TaxID=66871 RepID=UPI0013DD1842|nr:DUF4232 domain-containing protein [Streptomyces aureoverticillatus]QIB44309.1 DUF4232 domain-containing protein [Streptomyces aureoverticillatus]